MTAVARYPDSTKASLEQRLRARARDRWPQIAGLHIRHRGNFSYVDAALADSTTLKLCRLRYVGSASQWQFAIYRASHDDYDESVFPTGLPVGTCQDALDTACGLYLNDPTAWIQPPTNLRARPLSHGEQNLWQCSGAYLVDEHHVVRPIEDRLDRAEAGQGSRHETGRPDDLALRVPGQLLVLFL